MPKDDGEAYGKFLHIVDKMAGAVNDPGTEGRYIDALSNVPERTVRKLMAEC